MSTSDLATEQAIRAVARRHSGDWSDADEAHLQSWLAMAPENRAAFAAVERTWAVAGRLDRDRWPAPVHRRPVLRNAIAASAAVLLLASLLPAWHRATKWWNGVPQTWVTPRGQPRQLTLQDGTRVVLDADSEIIVRLGARARRILLVRGEALFDVRHEPSRPLQVEAGPGLMTDLGTRFQVESLGRSVRVAVLVGKVGISTPHGEVLLGSGQSSGFDLDGTLYPVSAFDSSAVLWPDGQRHFEAEPLSDVLAEFARYHPVTFVFDDPRLEQLPVSGVFRLADLALFLRTLAAAFPVQVRWHGPHRVEIASRPATTSGGNELKR